MSSIDPTESDDATDPDHPDAADSEILAARAHLDASRDALRRMHHDVVTTKTAGTAYAETDSFWENLFQQRSRERRADALVDLPRVPLFFGRLDYEPGTVFDRDTGQRPPSTGRSAAHGDGSTDDTADVDRLYIGRRHVHDPGGAPMVIDWRAPVSAAFYRATTADPQGVRLRRRFGFSEATGELTAFEDEPLIGPGAEDHLLGTERASTLVTAEIERPRSGPMRDIVATIQPEQDELVRAPLKTALCVQGAPGTGKTAVGLHRIAYLLFTERDKLSRDGIAIIGPNRFFLSYIRNVLPALGEVNVRQTTVEDLISERVAAAKPATTSGSGAAAPVERPTDDIEVARIKGDLRMAVVLRRALWSHIGVPDGGVMYTKGARRYRVHDYQISEILKALHGQSRYGYGRTALAQRIAHQVLLQMERQGESPDDRVQNAVARSKPVKQVLDRVWPKLASEQVLFRLYTDAEFRAAAAVDDLTTEEQGLLCWRKPYRSWRSATWTDADMALLDELDDLIERTGSLAHVVLDEAQDLSAMQLRAVGRRCRTGSATVLGDIAQGTSPWAAQSWETLLAHLGQPDAQFAELDRGFRVPAQIIDFAARLLRRIAPELAKPIGVRQARGALHITATEADTLPDAATAACRDALSGAGSVGVIVADADVEVIVARLAAEGLEPALLGRTDHAMDAGRLVCVPVTLAKGLEFDSVVVVEPAAIVEAESRGLHRLYVALTRAVSSLYVVHAEPLPAALAES